jgi:desulfoferrodoxin-like iron-binding protein
MAYREDFRMVNVTKEGQIFKCEICGNVVVVKESGGGELVCCGEPMHLESV